MGAIPVTRYLIGVWGHWPHERRARGPCPRFVIAAARLFYPRVIQRISTGSPQDSPQEDASVCRRIQGSLGRRVAFEPAFLFGPGGVLGVVGVVVDADDKTQGFGVDDRPGAGEFVVSDRVAHQLLHQAEIIVTLIIETVRQ